MGTTARGRFVHVPDKNIGLYRVRHLMNRDRLRPGEPEAVHVVAKLTDIWRPVELVPSFGKQCPINWTADTAVELSEDFYLNTFSDKDVYQAILN